MAALAVLEDGDYKSAFDNGELSDWSVFGWKLDNSTYTSKPYSLAMVSYYGVAYTPPVVISGMQNPELAWYCMHLVDSDSGLIRKVRVYHGYSFQLLAEWDIVKPKYVDTGVWHEHRRALDPAWGAVIVAFVSNTSWHIDNVEIREWSPFDMPLGPGIAPGSDEHEAASHGGMCGIVAPKPPNAGTGAILLSILAAVFCFGLYRCRRRMPCGG
jgi:hypothetical protein